VGDLYSFRGVSFLAEVFVKTPQCFVSASFLVRGLCENCLVFEGASFLIECIFT
jgi:hypothetical protein